MGEETYGAPVVVAAPLPQRFRLYRRTNERTNRRTSPSRKAFMARVSLYHKQLENVVNGLVCHINRRGSISNGLLRHSRVY